MALYLPRSVFIHIPKTGGTTIRRMVEGMSLDRGETGHSAMGPVVNQHSPFAWVKGESGSRKVFASVRHTLNWYQSIWCHRKRTDQGSGIVSDENYRSDFEEWVRHVSEAMPGHYGWKLCEMLDGSDPLLIETDVDLFGGLKRVLEEYGEHFDWPNPDETYVMNRASDEEKRDCQWTNELRGLIQSHEGDGEYPESFTVRYRDNLVSRESGVTI